MLMGFSVGGHVVANYNNLWSSAWLQAQTHLSTEDLKPAATILGYPVITHLMASLTNLLWRSGLTTPMRLLLTNT